MSPMPPARRARLDALMDYGDLAEAPAEERAWLEAERARDPEFDAEVRVLLGVEASLRGWGRGSASAVDVDVDAALAGVFAGIDAGLYDDDLDVTAPPRFDDAEHAVVALPVAAQARAGRRVHVMQALAAVAAVLLVVTAGVSVSRLSSPASSEAAVAMQSGAAPASAAPSAVAPIAPAPAPSPLVDGFARPEAPAEERAASPGLDTLAESQRSAPAMAAGSAAEGPTGYGGRATFEGAQVGSATPTTGSARAPAEAPRVADLMAPSGVSRDTRETLALAPDLPSAEAPAAVVRRSATTTSARPASDDAPSRTRFGSLSAIQLALARCLSAEREVTYEVASGSGAIQIVAAGGASAAELQCLRGVAQGAVLDPAPGVTRRQRALLGPSATVSDTSAR